DGEAGVAFVGGQLFPALAVQRDLHACVRGVHVRHGPVKVTGVVGLRDDGAAVRRAAVGGKAHANLGDRGTLGRPEDLVKLTRVQGLTAVGVDHERCRLDVAAGVAAVRVRLGADDVRVSAVVGL